ncbi:DUF418 domain-containing protein [Pseudomonas anguilliseptica]
MGVCAAIWLVQLLFANAWLARFQYGPFEGLWRVLSKGRGQPVNGSVEPS